MNIYIVVFTHHGHEVSTHVEAASYADAVSQFPSWIQVTKVTL